MLRGKDRIEQEAFSKFKAYYNFKALFCNPGSGNEKGGVEGLVGFARRNYMVPVPEAGGLEEINEKILHQCTFLKFHAPFSSAYFLSEGGSSHSAWQFQLFKPGASSPTPSI